MSGAAQNTSSRLVLTLGLLSLISGLLVAITYDLTKGPIAANLNRAMEAAVFEVLPGAASRADMVMGDDGPRPVQPGEKPGFYAAFDASGGFVGYALRAESRGYADVIELLYGYSPAKHAVVGMTVLRSNETPGLGDKIFKDAAFRDNFKALDVSKPEEHPVETVKHGAKTQPWQIDGISGATVSSKAVGKALRESTSRWIPPLRSAPAPKETP